MRYNLGHSLLKSGPNCLCLLWRFGGLNRHVVGVIPGHVTDRLAGLHLRWECRGWRGVERGDVLLVKPANGLLSLIDYRESFYGIAAGSSWS